MGRSILKTVISVISTILVIALVVAFLKSTGIRSVRDGLDYSRGLVPSAGNKIEKLLSHKWGGDRGMSVNSALDEANKREEEGIKRNQNNTDNSDNSNNEETTPTKVNEETENIAEKNSVDEAMIMSMPIEDISKEKAQNMLKSVKVGKEQKVKYDRSEWKHWSNQGSSCWNTREEVLYRSSKPGTIELRDKNKKVTKNKAKACYISKGEWQDPYSGKTFTNPNELDIDHIIPLKYVATHNGQEWSSKKKKAYANDYKDVLVVSSAKENRRKGDKGASDYMPQSRQSRCVYAKKYIYVADKYGISISKDDRKTLEKALSVCTY